MALLEQAVFTSAETDRSVGYQVVSKSRGLSDEDARALSVWGPSHDSLLELGPDAVSLNFHPLPSGAYCVSRTTAAGWEYSGRGGHRVYTQCLITPPEVLWQFANNPLMLLRAATASGALVVYQRLPAWLEPISLTGRTAPVDQSLLARLAANPGPQRSAVLVQAALDSACLGVAGAPSAEQLIAGLFSCLPLECRSEFFFSTGLKFSSRRPFRIVALSDDRTEQRRVAHNPNVTVLDLADDAPGSSTPLDGWARLIEAVLRSGRTSFLATRLSKRRSDLSVEDLPALGLQLLEDLDAATFRGDREEGDRRQGATASPLAPAESCREDGPAVDCEAAALQLAHAAHHRFEKSGAESAAAKSKQAAPSKRLEAHSPTVLGKLELLDDLVYEAIGGQTTALDELRTLWPEVLAEFGEELVAESREQYLRYALSIWENSVETGHLRNPSRAVQALDVLCLLFDA